MNNPQTVPNHTIDPTTGYVESNGFMDAFNATKKQAFLSLFKQNKLRFWRTAAELGVKGDTVQIHLNLDRQFKADYEQTKIEFYDNLEGTSRENAENPRSVIERIFQLKAAFPDKYGDGKRESALNIQINFDGKALEMTKKREQVLEAEVIPGTQNLATESGGLSANQEGKTP